MRFDMSRAWADATGRIGANREMMMVVAGVFFLLPNLLFYILYSDVQAQAVSDLMQVLAGKAPSASAGRQAPAGYVAVAFLLTFVQFAGFVALTALLGDRERPTVGEAIARGFRSLPTLIGAALLVALGFLVFTAILGIVIALSGGVMVIASLLLLAAAAMGCYVSTRLSLLLPVVVLERQRNPFAALRRSWRLVEGNGLLLFLFYLLLMVVYVVLSLLMLGLMSLLMGLMGGGLAMFLAGLVSGTLSAAANVVFVAIVVAAYRQLAGNSSQEIEQTFS